MERKNRPYRGIAAEYEELDSGRLHRSQVSPQSKDSVVRAGYISLAIGVSAIVIGGLLSFIFLTGYLWQLALSLTIAGFGLCFLLIAFCAGAYAMATHRERHGLKLTVIAALLGVGCPVIFQFATLGAAMGGMQETLSNFTDSIDKEAEEMRRRNEAFLKSLQSPGSGRGPASMPTPAHSGRASGR